MPDFEDLVEDIRQVRRVYGRPFDTDEFNEVSDYHPYTFRKELGVGIHELNDLAGFDYLRSEKSKKIHPQATKRAIEVAKRWIDPEITVREFDNRMSISRESVKRWFGTWNRARDVPRYRDPNSQWVSREQVVNDIYEWAFSHARTPRTQDVSESFEYSRADVKESLGITWVELLHELGLPRESKWVEKLF